MPVVNVSHQAAGASQRGNLTFGSSPGIVGLVNDDNARPLGEWLRQCREELGISLQQAEADTRIRARYLEALEANDFESLPGSVAGRGFLRNYAAYLNLDPQKAVERFSELGAPPPPEVPSAEEPSPFSVGPFRPVPLHRMPGERSGRIWLVALAVIVVAALAVLAWRGYPTIAGWLARWRLAVQPTPTQRSSVALTTATHTPTAIATATGATTASPSPAAPTLELTLPPTFTPSPSPSPSPPVYTGIFLELVFSDTSWIQVTADGVRQFQGELEPPTYRSWYGEKRIELRIGNAGAVLVTVNGQSLGTLGAPGEVIDRIFEVMDGQVTEATPTREITGTLTAEPTARPTRKPTAAPPTPGTPTAAPIAPTQPVTPTVAITPTIPVTPTAGP
jgi:cytoskeletal protein RodZ